MERLITTFKALRIHAPGLTSKVGILRSLFSEIEAAKNEGYEYGTILSELIKNGYGQTKRNQFYGLMNRIRLEQGYTTQYKRQPSVDHAKTCPRPACDILSNSKPNIPSAQPTLIPATVEELKTASRSFDIDPTNYD